MKHQNNPLWWMLLVTLVGVLLFCTLNNAPAQTVPQIAEKALAATASVSFRISLPGEPQDKPAL